LDQDRQHLRQKSSRQPRQPTGGGKAAITGDYALIGLEVPDVVCALCSDGIEVTTIHSHMLTEEPRIFFLRFWADDDALKLVEACAPLSTKRPAPGADSRVKPEGALPADLSSSRSLPSASQVGLV
jgi:hypothetical protein